MGCTHDQELARLAHEAPGSCVLCLNDALGQLRLEKLKAEANAKVLWDGALHLMKCDKPTDTCLLCQQVANMLKNPQPGEMLMNGVLAGENLRRVAEGAIVLLRKKYQLGIPALEAAMNEFVQVTSSMRAEPPEAPSRIIRPP